MVSAGALPPVFYALSSHVSKAAAALRTVEILAFLSGQQQNNYVHIMHSFSYIYSITQTEPAACVPRVHAQLYYYRAERPLLRLAFYDKPCFTNRIYPTECYKDAISLFCTSRQYLHLTAQMWGLVRIFYEAILYMVNFFKNWLQSLVKSAMIQKSRIFACFWRTAFHFIFIHKIFCLVAILPTPNRAVFSAEYSAVIDLCVQLHDLDENATEHNQYRKRHC